ncbi:hypothetical protein CKAH01_12064 [Colletotrichum kahawae]|uniref:Uncharacterized protein n=1 Tax=Colletotrichum kahawae TaxID=34407 RepID=A0AAE0DCZ4_COLKA|nr:hypothetical protein CKAH01_12064 [Colletotrichum kahawae]
MDPRPNQPPLDEPDLKLKAGTLGSEQQQQQQQQPKVGSLRLGSSPRAFCSQNHNQKHPSPESSQLQQRQVNNSFTTHVRPPLDSPSPIPTNCP